MKKVELDKILDIINKTEDLYITSTQINDNLVDLGMDSIKFVQLVVSLEEEFECEIPDSKLLITEMDTVQKIQDVLQALYEDNNGKTID